MVLTEKEVNSLSALPPAPGHVHRLGSSQQLGLRPTLGQMQRSDLWLEMLILRSRLELPHCGGYLMAQSWPLPNQPCLTLLPLSTREFDTFTLLYQNFQQSLFFHRQHLPSENTIQIKRASAVNLPKFFEAFSIYRAHRCLECARLHHLSTAPQPQHLKTQHLELSNSISCGPDGLRAASFMFPVCSECAVSVSLSGIDI